MRRSFLYNPKLKKLGLKVLRFWNDDILNGLDEVAKIIHNEIN